jgi:hypothetical protein
MRRLAQGLVIAAFCALSIVPFQPTHAQSQPTSPQISDRKLDAAAKAIKQLHHIQQSYDEKLKKTAPADQDRVISAADAEMKKAVTDQGLSVEEFATILQTAQNDPAVHQRLVQRLQRPAK